MPDDLPLASRRVVLAGLTASATAILASLPASAEKVSAVPVDVPVRRPWGEFEIARGKAFAAKTPEQAEAIMLGFLGPLPWRFEGGSLGEDVDVLSLARMAPPQHPDEVTGVWAVALCRQPGSDGPGHYALILCGRMVIRAGQMPAFDRMAYAAPALLLGSLYGHVMWTMHYGVTVLDEAGAVERYRVRGVYASHNSFRAI